MPTAPLDCRRVLQLIRRPARPGPSSLRTPQAGAYRTVLTHFSQRYPGPPPDAEGDAGGWEAAGAVAAVDGMVVPLRGAGFERLPGTGRLAVSVLVALREAGSGGCGEEAGEQGGVAYDSE